MSKGKKQKRKYLADAVKGAPSVETTKLPPPPHPMIESIVVRDVATYAHERSKNKRPAPSRDRPFLLPENRKNLYFCK